MNNTRIEWSTKSWNPITGCLNGCQYCYARKIYQLFGRSFKPQIHSNRLNQPFKIKKPERIFVCSVSDLWGKGIKEVWREEVFKVIRKCRWHTYITLTKQPQNINDDIPENLWLGVTITKREDIWRWAKLSKTNAKFKFISFEPLLGDVGQFDMTGLDWIIIGRMTGVGSKNYQPNGKWVESLIQQAKRNSIPVFIKYNLTWRENLEEFPEKMKVKDSD